MNAEKPTSVETEETQRDQKETRPAPPVWVPAPAPDVNREEEQVQSVREMDEVAPQESVSQFSSNLSFACVLIPRFSDHFLVGDIVDSLRDWMKQACISYSWRLDAIAVRPGYIQWVMTVPLNANPAHCMRLIRRYTSEKIFDDFPRFKHKNISGEFWAPGNFVVPGNRLQTPEQVNEFILQTRRQQGIV